MDALVQQRESGEGVVDVQGFQDLVLFEFLKRHQGVLLNYSIPFQSALLPCLQNHPRCQFLLVLRHKATIPEVLDCNLPHLFLQHEYPGFIETIVLE